MNKEKTDNENKEREQLKQIIEEKDKIAQEKEKEIQDKQKTIDDYTDHLKRLQAEFENYIKRTDKEKEEFKSFATQKIILDLLIIIDEFRLALNQIKKDNISPEFCNGVEMIFNNLHKMLENQGVKEIEAKGKKFDPYKHEAIIQVHVDNLSDNIVVEELQKGYMLKEKILRYSKVSINKRKIEENQNQEEK